MIQQYITSHKGYMAIKIEPGKWISNYGISDIEKYVHRKWTRIGPMHWLFCDVFPYL